MKRNNNLILERDLMSSETYVLYDFLQDNGFIGQDRAIKQKELIPLLNSRFRDKYRFTDRIIRDCIAENNNYQGNVKVICASRNGIYIAKNSDEVDKYFQVTLKKGISQITKAWNIRKKGNQDGQLRLTFGPYEKAVMEAFVHQEINS